MSCLLLCRARRWNLTVSYFLRVLLYEPIMEGSLWPRAPTQALESDSTACASKVQPPGPAPVTADISLVAVPTQFAADPAKAQPDSSFSSMDTHRSDQSKHHLRHAKHSRTEDMAASPAAGAGSSAYAPKLVQPRHILLRKFIAVQAAFALSGLWHALIWYNNNHTWASHWFLFFILQGPICLVEGVLAKWCKSMGLQVPKAVGMVLTQGMLTWMSSYLFLGPLRTSGLDARVMAVPVMISSYLLGQLQFCIPYPGGPCLN
jgi:hypothetical protein